MAGEKTEFVFPDEQEEKKQEKTTTSDFEIEVADDTPEKDRGRKPLDKEIKEPTDEELEGYGEKVKARINELTHARHDERRRREELEREHNEAIRLAQAALEENKRLKKSLEEGSTTTASQSKELAEIRLAQAKSKMKAAHEAGDSDALVEAQQEVSQAVLALNGRHLLSPPPCKRNRLRIQLIPQHRSGHRFSKSLMPKRQSGASRTRGLAMTRK